jgi:2-polyprenyl-6-methoxyphenol hydroxylase-like FAD-dependent oxidoreductase
MELRGQELTDLVLRLTADWHPDLRRLFELTDSGTCFPVNIWTSVPLEPWTTSNVTLLGDAIHTMTPGRGVGANTALRDAHLLCRKLVDVRDGRAELLDAVDPIHKPVVGRLVLAGLRTAMRTVNQLPPLKRRMRDSMLAYRGADRAEDEFVITPPAPKQQSAPMQESVPVQESAPEQEGAAMRQNASKQLQ